MESIKEKKLRYKTLSDDHPRTILKPGLEETVGNDFGSVVVTTRVVEKTEVSVVKMGRQGDHFMKNQDKGGGNEVIEGQKQGFFGNLVNDEGLKVNCSENGAPMVMDAEDSLPGENGSYEHPVFKRKTGFLADQHDGNAKRDPMDICSSDENKKNGDYRVEICESKKDMSKNDEENVEKRDDNGKGLADDDVEYDKEQVENELEDHSFVVGDFVWGKIKSHPWWPGQIYDPSAASAYAASLRRKGRVLVAHFGDGSFSWCSPSQLKPFVDHFREMSSQSDSKKFVNAVRKGLEEIGRLVEAELTCKCQTVDTTENAGVINSGIKGARVPKGNTIKVLVDRIDPVELVSTLKGYATMEPGTTPVDLELTVLKSCLKAFYTRKGGYLLADYHDTKCIEGLEEETRGRVTADSDTIGPSESPENGDDQLYQTRKQKSVAELLGDDESKIKKGKASKDGGMKGTKRKALVVLITPESEHERGGGGVEEETMSPRQRKKSRYLSPPYLSPIGSGKLSVLGSGTGSGSFKDEKSEPEKISEMVAKQLEDSSKKSSGSKTREKRRVPEESGPQEHEKMDATVNATKVLDGLLCAALDPSSFVEKEKNLPAITELVSSFRSSIFEEGSCNQTDEKQDSEDGSELAFIKQKLEWMSEMVHMCGESEMSADVKASLEGGIQQVLEKVVKMRGK